MKDKQTNKQLITERDLSDLSMTLKWTEQTAMQSRQSSAISYPSNNK